MSKIIIEELLTEQQIAELLNDEEIKRAYEQFLKDNEQSIRDNIVLDKQEGSKKSF